MVQPGGVWFSLSFLCFSLVVSGSAWLFVVSACGLCGSAWLCVVQPGRVWFSLVACGSACVLVIQPVFAWFSLLFCGSAWFFVVQPVFFVVQPVAGAEALAAVPGAASSPSTPLGSRPPAPSRSARDPWHRPEKTQRWGIHRITYRQTKMQEERPVSRLVSRLSLKNASLIGDGGGAHGRGGLGARVFIIN